MARNRDAPFFGWVFVLAMAALEIHEEPSFPLHELDCITDFQRLIVALSALICPYQLLGLTRAMR